MFLWFPQSLKTTRWLRRRDWIHGLVTAARNRDCVSVSTSTASSISDSGDTTSVAVEGKEWEPVHAMVLEDDMRDVTALLRDHRVVRANGKLMCSVISGMVTHLLTGCCSDVECPTNRAYSE